MLRAVVKLCCGISYPHIGSTAGLNRTALAAIGHEIAYINKEGPITLAGWTRHMNWSGNTLSSENRREAASNRPMTLREEDLVYVKQGQEALERALEIVEDKIGWKTEISEENGDVIYSKVLPGARKVFKLEAVLDASPEELHSQLFVKVEEMKLWNPNIKNIKVLKQVGDDTMVTHEVSAETAGNLIGQRDFLSVRHCCKKKSCVYLAGVSTQLKSFPAEKGFVRAHDGPTCIIIQQVGENTSKFTWLLNMDLKGWLPRSIVNQALPRAQADFAKCLRKHLSLGRLSPSSAQQ